MLLCKSLVHADSALVLENRRKEDKTYLQEVPHRNQHTLPLNPTPICALPPIQRAPPQKNPHPAQKLYICLPDLGPQVMSLPYDRDLWT